MAKNNLVLLATLLLATTLLTTAFTTITTITTTTNDEGSNPGRYQQCQRQLQGRQFRSCQSYFSQGQSLDGEIEMVSTDVANPGQQEQQYLRACCERIRQVDEQCQCEAIKQAVRSSQQQQPGGGYGGQQMQQVYQKARSLPQQCGLRIGQCEIRAIFV